MSQRKIAVFTGNRAEYGFLYPIINKLKEEDELETSLIISGSHLSNEYGETIDEIDTSSVAVVKRIKTNETGSHKKKKILDAFSLIIKESGGILEDLQPDLLLIAGDRYETFAVATSSFYMNIPVVHLFGGDLSQGGHLDDSVRHCITKLAHVHLATNKDSYDRILGLGEEEWRVHNVGSPAVDNVVNGDYASREELVREFDLKDDKPLILFTQHPITTESEKAREQVIESINAFKEIECQVVVTYPCNDTGSKDIIEEIEKIQGDPKFIIVKSLGMRRYLGVMNIASVVAGNSSSGLMETPVFHVPCVNIGNRQNGRLRAANVIDVVNKKDAIKDAIRKCLENADFQKVVEKVENPYGDGKSSERIISILKELEINTILLQKKMTY